MKKYSLVLMILVFVLLIPLTVSANSPPPVRIIGVRVFEKPVDCVYVDLLIKIDSEDENYIALNSGYCEKLGFDENSEIVQYSKNGYASYTFHFLDAVSDNTLVKKESSDGSAFYDAEFAKYYITDTGFSSTALSRLRNGYSNMKLVLLDAQGGIIQISDRFDIGSSSHSTRGGVIYHAETNTIEVNEYVGSFVRFLQSIMTLLLIALFRFIFSIGTETLIAAAFKLKPYWKIVTVNLITQLILTIAMAFSSYDYWITVIALEVFVYLSEFAIYSMLYKNFSKTRILLYTVIANTASLGFGLLLNYLGIFKG